MHVLRRPQLEPSQWFFCAPEGPLRVVEVVHPGHHPSGPLLDAGPTKTGEAVEDAVEDQRAEEQLGRVVDGQVVLGADVLAPTEVVGDRHGVVVERRVEQPAAAPDVQDEGHTRLLQQPPERVESRMGRCPFTSRGGWHLDCGTAQVEGILGQRHRPVGIGQRHEANGQQPRICRAEIGDCPVHCPAPAVEPIQVAAHELGGGEGREHQLAPEPQQIEDAAALLAVEGTQGHPALVDQQALLGLGGLGGVRAASLGPRHRLIEHRSQSLHLPSPQALDELGLDVRVEETGQLHQVAIGIEDASVTRIAHGGLPGV
jgi:hypothetical protein